MSGDAVLPNTCVAPRARTTRLPNIDGVMKKPRSGLLWEKASECVAGQLATFTGQQGGVPLPCLPWCQHAASCKCRLAEARAHIPAHAIYPLQILVAVCTLQPKSVRSRRAAEKPLATCWLPFTASLEGALIKVNYAPKRKGEQSF